MKRQDAMDRKYCQGNSLKMLGENISFIQGNQIWEQPREAGELAFIVIFLTRWGLEQRCYCYSKWWVGPGSIWRERGSFQSKSLWHWGVNDLCCFNSVMKLQWRCNLVMKSRPFSVDHTWYMIIGTQIFIRMLFHTSK